MGKVRYIPNQQALDRYYLHQTGGGVDDSFFAGPTYQRGHGLGGLFGRMFRAAVPLFRTTVAPVLKKAGRELAKEALHTGVGVGTDLLDGKSLGDSVKGRLNTAANRMATKGARSLQGMLTGPYGAPRKRGRSVRRVNAAKRARKTIKGNDIFG